MKVTIRCLIWVVLEAAIALFMMVGGVIGFGLAKPMCGEMNATALLTNEKVLEIRRLSAQGLKDAAIAPMFGISRVTVYDIRTRKTWKHI